MAIAFLPHHSVFAALSHCADYPEPPPRSSRTSGPTPKKDGAHCPRCCDRAYVIVVTDPPNPRIDALCRCGREWRVA
jgi:hypothetical protein